MRALIGVLVLLTAAAGAWFGVRSSMPDLSPSERTQVRALMLDTGAPARDPTNRVLNDPRAAHLGHRLFFDTALSGNGAVACATCHQPARRFTDGLQVSRAIGESRRNAPSLIGIAHSPWLYWDGRKDSVWAQALSPLEDAAEHGGNRMRFARLMNDREDYRVDYVALFGPLPDFTDARRFPLDASPLGPEAWRSAWRNMAAEDRLEVDRVFVNVGKALAAYQALLVAGESRFDRFAASLQDTGDVPEGILSPAEVRGLRLFVGQAGCTQCHNGPLLTNHSFHNTGLLSRPGQLPDIGRAAGLRLAQADPFNCLGGFSDAPDECHELRFAGTGPEFVGAFRTPSLRNLEGTAPYGHAGQFATLRDVLEHYDEAPDAMIGHNEAKPLDLWPWQLDDLEAFLDTLQAPPTTDARWLQAPDR